MADALRIVTILMALCLCAFLPVVIGLKGRPSRTWLLFLCIELYIFSAIISMGNHLGEPLVWYRAPILFIANVAGVIYMGLTVRSWRKHEPRGSIK